MTITESDEPKTQIARALAFLTRERDELMRLVRFGGIDEVVLDFSCAQREYVTRTARLPAELLTAAGALGIEIDVSFYLVA